MGRGEESDGLGEEEMEGRRGGREGGVRWRELEERGGERGSGRAADE